MKRLAAHLEAVQARRNIFELFLTVLWAFPIFLVLKFFGLFKKAT